MGQDMLHEGERSWLGALAELSGRLAKLEERVGALESRRLQDGADIDQALHAVDEEAKAQRVALEALLEAVAGLHALDAVRHGGEHG